MNDIIYYIFADNIDNISFIGMLVSAWVWLTSSVFLYRLYEINNIIEKTKTNKNQIIYYLLKPL